MDDKLVYNRVEEDKFLKILIDALGRFRIVHGTAPYDPIFMTMNMVEAARWRNMYGWHEENDRG